ncbi:MAG: hypothetical protein IPN34_17600 [Planctomycetes bacterium]|nr:hypothetical protein [Planctomycetota bacterium]
MVIQLPLLIGLSSAATAWQLLKDTRLQVKFQPGGGVITYRGGRHCGPGWGSLQDYWFDPIDKACRAHDQCYREFGWFTKECNLQLMADLVAVAAAPESTRQQRVDALVMAAFFATEAELVDPWLRPASRLGTSVIAWLRAELGEKYEEAVELLWFMQQDVYRIYKVPR